MLVRPILSNPRSTTPPTSTPRDAATSPSAQSVSFRSNEPKRRRPISYVSSFPAQLRVEVELSSGSAAVQESSILTLPLLNTSLSCGRLADLRNPSQPAAPSAWSRILESFTIDRECVSSSAVLSSHASAPIARPPLLHRLADTLSSYLSKFCSQSSPRSTPLLSRRRPPSRARSVPRRRLPRRVRRRLRSKRAAGLTCPTWRRLRSGRRRRGGRASVTPTRRSSRSVRPPLLTRLHRPVEDLLLTSS